MINNFIVNTADFLNVFSNTIEKKIASASNKITNLETLLAVLEAKLNSIPDLNVPESMINNNKTTPVRSESDFNGSNGIKSNLTVETNSFENITTSSSQQTQITTTSLSQCNSEYLPYIKLLKVGVPLIVVQAKVADAGLNPELINNPDLLLMET